MERGKEGGFATNAYSGGKRKVREEASGLWYDVEPTDRPTDRQVLFLPRPTAMEKRERETTEEEEKEWRARGRRRSSSKWPRSTRARIR